MIPYESIVVFWNTLMFLLAVMAVIIPLALIAILIIDRKIVTPQYEQMEKDE